MTQNDKKPEDDFLIQIGKDFTEAVTDTRTAVLDGLGTLKQGASDAIDSTMRGARIVKDVAEKGYKAVEDTVGRERLWGAGIGAKAGGLFAASKPHPFYIPAIGAGVILGGAFGFVAGPYLARRYNQANKVGEEGNDNAKAETPAAPAPTPKNMEP